MDDSELKKYFYAWLDEPECPWYVLDQYLNENGLRKRTGAGPSRKRTHEGEQVVEEGNDVFAT